MKILWVKNNFPLPARGGGHIRTYEMLRRLRLRGHEIHYVAFKRPYDSMMTAGACCDRMYPVGSRTGSLSTAPGWVQRLRCILPDTAAGQLSHEMRSIIDALVENSTFDRVVCDFPFVAVNITSLSRCILFEHNVEYKLLQRMLEFADSSECLPLSRALNGLYEFEKAVCQRAGRVVAVSRPDAEEIQKSFDMSDVDYVPTGVDVDYYTPLGYVGKVYDLAFVGTMNWEPNIDAVTYFVREILPIIRSRVPRCSLIIVGHSPTAATAQMVERDPLITLTGSVPDVRPWLWRSCVSVLPLRIGSGTRLKVFESMAAQVPVVSTSLGIEGLQVEAGRHVLTSDSSQQFAQACVDLLLKKSDYCRIRDAAYSLVKEQCTWDRAVDRFLANLQKPLSPRTIT